MKYVIIYQHENDIYFMRGSFHKHTISTAMVHDSFEDAECWLECMPSYFGNEYKIVTLDEANILETMKL